MKNKTLVILAAGMGSRFGGLKQIEPIGPNKEIIADYSVYDAIRAGFNKVVFVIKEENYNYFKENIISKFADKIQVEFAFQSLSKIPSDVTLPVTREKMLGTGHALWCAQDLIEEPFVMINADDFYGDEPYKIAAQFIDENKDDYEYMTVNYPFYLTASENGSVNRGLVKEQNGYVIDVEECTVTPEKDRIIAQNKITLEEKTIEKNQAVSMNFYVFKPSIFKFLNREFDKFIHGTITDKNEFYMTEVLKTCLANKEIKYRAETTSSKWLGVTYKEDLSVTKETLQTLIDEGKYPSNLWEK